MSDMTNAVQIAIAAGNLPPKDFGAVQLAKRYAALIDAAVGEPDEVRVIGDLGPKLLAVLTSLGLTLAGRSTGTKGGETSGGNAPVPATPASVLAGLRANRGAAARAAHAAGLATGHGPYGGSAIHPSAS